MKSRIEEVLSRILSEKYDAKIKITFKEKNHVNSRESNRGVGRTTVNTR